MKKLFSADLDAVLAKAKTELASAVDRSQRLKREFDVEFVGLHASGNEVAIQRRRQQIAQADAAVSQLAEAAGRIEREHEAVIAREKREAEQARWDEAASIGQQFIADAERVQRAANELAAAVTQMQERSEALRKALPAKPGYVDNNSLVWSPVMIARRAGHQLVARCGAFVNLSVNLSPWDAQQQGEFMHHARDSVARAFAPRPTSTDPSTPEAA